jgi:CDP-glucose 4,6-dehydratase
MSERAFWEGKSVFVTGATGFLGYWLVKALCEQKAQVVILARDLDPRCQLLKTRLCERTHVVSGALEDFHSVERAINTYETQYVFHLGAQTIVGTSYRNPLATFESNIRGTYHLLEACRWHKSFVKAVIVASSDKAYGSSAVLPYTEETPLRGLYPYDVSKSCADLIAMSYFHTYALPVAITRCGNLFGGGDLNWSRLIPGTIRSLWQGISPEIRSDGKSTRDYLYVKDAARAYLRLAESLETCQLQGEAFNFGHERPYTVLEIAQAIQLLMGRSDLSFTISDNARHEIIHQSLQSKKAQELLDWSPQFTLEQGLIETIAWYDQFLQERDVHHAYFST